MAVTLGDDDQLGMLNHLSDTSRVAALRLVRAGRMYDLGRVLDEHVPVFPGRYFRQTLVTTTHHQNRGGLGANRVNWITEQITGTQQRVKVRAELLGARQLLGDPVDAIGSQPAGVLVVRGGDQRLAEVAPGKHRHVLIEHPPQVVHSPERTSRSAAARELSLMWLSIPS